MKVYTPSNSNKRYYLLADLNKEGGYSLKNVTADSIVCLYLDVNEEQCVAADYEDINASGTPIDHQSGADLQPIGTAIDVDTVFMD